MYNQYSTFFSHHKYRNGDKGSFSRTLSDVKFQLTDPWSTKRLQVVENSKIWFSRSGRKTDFCKNLQRKSAHFCKDFADLYGSSRFSATIFAEPFRKILEICTDLQKFKTWVRVIICAEEQSCKELKESS